MNVTARFPAMFLFLCYRSGICLLDLSTQVTALTDVSIREMFFEKAQMGVGNIRWTNTDKN
jgi:hypothetical protein